MLRTTNLPRTTRRGILSAELLLTLPILTVLLFGLLEFSLLFFARGDVVEASRAGARAARLYGATTESVEAEVLSSLGGRLAAHAYVLGAREGLLLAAVGAAGRADGPG